jgi:hypothetical protein
MSMVQIGTGWYTYLFVPVFQMVQMVQHPLGVYQLYQHPSLMQEAIE